MATLLTEEIKGYVGLETPDIPLGDPVEQGAVRRYAQAVLDADPIYMDHEYAAATRYGAPVAPPLFPVTMMRTAFGASDPLGEHAHDPDFHGLADNSAMGLPPLPLGNSTQLNAGSEVELFRYARHGEKLSMRSRYLDIFERRTSRGLMLFVIVETDFKDASGSVICRFRKTLLRQ